jgi:RsiW-degrading membrane proteinase PrsW (M82 family)
MDQTPPALNLKCIVFTWLLTIGYWYLPSRNKYVLLGLSYFPYLALAWYDYIYACKHNFGPTYLAHFYSWAKPQSSRQIQIYKNWDPRIKNKVLLIDLAVLGGCIALLPLWLKWKPRDMNESERKGANIRGYVLLAIVILVFFYLRFFYVASD